jgi:hypothetical protein
MTARSSLLFTLAFVCAVGVAHAGPPEQSKRATVAVATPDKVVAVPAQDGHQVIFTPSSSASSFDFVAGALDASHGVVKDAPYSAEAVNETIQPLVDGNRIVRKSGSAVYRDGAGRTRREQAITAVGPIASTSRAQPIVINDPVSGFNYMLDPEKRTAHKTKAMQFKIADVAVTGASKADMEKVVAKVAEEIRMKQTEGAIAAAGGTGAVTVYSAMGSGAFQPATVFHAEGATAENTKTEPLGTKTIEGVSCEGTRTVTTIPAGQIGNEQPIEIVSERWYSPELKIVVMTKRTDPRVGESIYRLTNIVRAEPDASLFQVPADYTITESPMRWNFRQHQ